ncbi:MAG: hypothetical protein RL094_484 [Candidatus Parcubacteria bacterium]
MVCPRLLYVVKPGAVSVLVIRAGDVPAVSFFFGPDAGQDDADQKRPNRYAGQKSPVEEPGILERNCFWKYR